MGAFRNNSGDFDIDRPSRETPKLIILWRIANADDPLVGSFTTDGMYGDV